MEDRSLEDFLDGDEDEASDDDGSGEADSGDSAEPTGGDTPADAESGDTDGETATDGLVDPAAVEPARSTSRFVPDGAACDACSEVSTRLWIDGEQTVCGSCKSWD